MNQEFNEAIDRIAKYGKEQGSTMDDKQFLDYAYCYSYISEKFNGQKRTLKRGCGGCVMTAKKIVWNYIKQYHLVIPDEAPQKAKVTRVEVNKSPNYKELLATAKEKGFKGKNPRKQELIDYING